MKKAIVIKTQDEFKAHVKAQLRKQFKAHDEQILRNIAQAEFDEHMQARRAEYSRPVEQKPEEAHTSLSLTFEKAVQAALDELAKLRGPRAWNLECYPNSTSWCKIQLKGKTVFTVQANQKACVMITRKKLSLEGEAGTFAGEAWKLAKGSAQFKPETPEALRDLMIAIMKQF